MKDEKCFLHFILHPSDFILGFPMDTSPPFIPGKRRVHRKRRQPPMATPPPAALNVTGVIDISYGGDILSFSVLFDTTAENPLAPFGEIDPGKWIAVYAGQVFACVSMLLADYNRIELGFENGGPWEG